MEIGDVVRVVKCDVCPDVVGKTATVKSFSDNGTVELKFGRGRPPKDRPSLYNVKDVCAVDNS